MYSYININVTTLKLFYELIFATNRIVHSANFINLNMRDKW